MLKNISLYALFGVFSKSFALLLTPIIARSLSVEDFGNYILLVSVIMLVQSVFLFGFEHSLNYFFNKLRSQNSKKVLVSTQTIFIVVSFLMFSFISSPLLSSKVENINLILVWGGLSLLFVYWSTLLKVNMDVKVFVKSQMLQSMVLFGLVYLLVIIYPLSLNGVIYANIVTFCITILYMCVFIKQLVSWSFNIKLLKKVLAYGLPLMPSGALLWASMQLDRYFILYFLNEYILGTYSFALAVVMIPIFLKTAVKSAIDPFIMKCFHKDPDSAKLVISNYFTLSLIVFCFLFLFLSLFSFEVVMIMGGEKYLDSTSYIPWLLLISTITVCNQFFVYGINFAKKNGYILKGLLYMLFMNIVLMVFLIKFLSIYGVLVANLAANVFYTIYLAWQSNKLYRIEHHKSRNLVIFLSTLIVFISNYYMFPESYIFKFVTLFIFVCLNMEIVFFIKKKNAIIGI